MNRQLDVPDDIVGKLQSYADKYGIASWDGVALEALTHWVSGQRILSDDEWDELQERKHRTTPLPTVDPTAFAQWKRDNGW